jgi:hypothetical protein
MAKYSTHNLAMFNVEHIPDFSAFISDDMVISFSSFLSNMIKVSLPLTYFNNFS